MLRQRIQSEWSHGWRNERSPEETSLPQEDTHIFRIDRVKKAACGMVGKVTFTYLGRSTMGIVSCPSVAYFCMEYGLHEDLRIYSGGLGILAGDHIKTARDLGIPLVAIGIFWKHGYADEYIGKEGYPHNRFPENSYDSLVDTGVKVHVRVTDEDLALRVWRVDRYGNADLYLLDADLPENERTWVTGYLYGGFSPEDRIAQEIVLGIGGIRALRALDIPVDIYHFNEGHAVLAGVELIREKMIGKGMTFSEAWEATRREIVFTTHTPVPAGNEEHHLDALRRAGAFNGLTRRQMRAIGGDPFNMTVAGLRLARLSNAVSRIHEDTATKMWRHVQGVSPILAITNGVHRRTWQDERITRARTLAAIDRAHKAAKADLLAEIESRKGVRLNPDVLLLGFARRAAEYKRNNLVFSRPEVIEPLLTGGKLQMVFSGKAHPQDDGGKAIIADLVAMSRKFPQSVVFLENYDMEIGRLLTRGCDVWLNTPRRPNEASGTSGMKAAMNGVLNVSILDGWWPEICQHGVNGWQIGGEYEESEQDARDAESLYAVLINEILPVYYSDRRRWLRMMHSSISCCQYRFSSERMMKDYCRLMYSGEPPETAAVTG